KGNSDTDASTMLSNTFNFEKIEIGKAIQLQKGTEIAILTFGTIGQKIQNVISSVNEQSEIYGRSSRNLREKFGHYKFIFCKPLDLNLLGEVFNQYKTIVTFEDGILNGGFGDAILEYAQEREFKGKIIRKGYTDGFIGHAS